MKKNVIVIVWIFLILFIRILYSQTDAKVVPDSSRIIRIGYPAAMLSHVDSRDARVAIELWTNQLIGDLKLTVKTNAYSFPDLVSLVMAIDNKKVDLVMLSGLDFFVIKCQVALEPFLVGVTEAGSFKQYVFLSHKDIQSDDFTILQNKKIVIHTQSKNDDLPRLWLETLFMKNGITALKDFFKEITEVPTASRAILNVFFRQSDVCLVAQNAFQTAAELNPQLAHDLKILHQSPGFLGNLVCFRENYDEKIKQIIRDRSVAIHTYPKGEQILTLFHLKRMIPYDDSYLENIQSLLNEHEALKIRLGNNR